MGITTTAAALFCLAAAPAPAKVEAAVTPGHWPTFDLARADADAVLAAVTPEARAMTDIAGELGWAVERARRACARAPGVWSIGCEAWTMRGC